MNKDFEKFKRKVWTDILVKCVLAALAAGALAVNAVLLPCKLCGIHLLWVYYVLIALGGMALGGGIAFLTLRTNDKKISIRLDSELSLNERVQTTLECGNAQGDVIDMLKEDTNEVLKRLPARSLPFRHLTIAALCCAIAVAGVVAVPVISYTVPPVFAAVETPPVDKDPPRPVTDWEYAALDDLIKYVQNSKKMDATVKSGTLSALNGLRTVLLNGVTQNSLSVFVRNTVTTITNCVKDANDAYPKIDDDTPHPQAQANSEEEAYVVTTLYSIFHLLPEGGEKPGNLPGDNPNGGENGPGVVGPGIFNENETPFYDPLKGYVTCGSARGEYMEKVQRAFDEGAISREEWEFIMMTYFADLGKINNDD